MAIEDKSTIGLFITSETITIVHSEYRDGKCKVIAIGASETPRDCMENGTVSDPSRVGQAVRFLLRDMNITPQAAKVALPADGYSMRTLRFPEVPAGERRALVRGEMDQSSMLAPGRDEYDFLWLTAPEEQGRRQADAYVYYSDATAVESMRETVRVAGLRFEHLEPASLALVRSYVTVHPEPVAVLCPSKKHSDLVIFDGTRVRSLRRIPTGTDDFVAADNKRAVAPRVRRALDGEEHRVAGGETEAGVDQAVIGLSDSMENTNVAFLVSEVARSLAFFSREYPEASRQQGLVVLGADRVTSRVNSFLQGAIPVPIVTRDPLEAYRLPPGDTADSASTYCKLVALGASLGGEVDAVPALNLAQQGAAALIRKKAPVVLLAGMGGSTVWMSAAIIAAGVLMLLTSRMLRQSADISKQIADIQEARAPLLRKQQIWEAAQSARALSQVPAASVLGRVAAASTPGVMLTSFKVSRDGKISIEGKATNSDDMQRFADALGRGKVIKSPRFDAMRQDPKEGLTFRIVSVFRGTQADDKKPAQ